MVGEGVPIKHASTLCVGTTATIHEALSHVVSLTIATLVPLAVETMITNAFISFRDGAAIPTVCCFRQS